MMANAKKQDTGVKLEVNEKILDACTTLMQAIKELIKNSKELQHEIISQGKVSENITMNHIFKTKNLLGLFFCKRFLSKKSQMDRRLNICCKGCGVSS